jgi:predicted ATPase
MSAFPGEAREANVASATNGQERDQPVEGAKPPFLRRVRIRGYKSIAFCDVTLEPLTILVGRNASGKSNFLDALAFLRDAMEFGLGEALKRRGGIRSILCRNTQTDTFSMEIETAVTEGQAEKKDYLIRYRFSIRASEGNAVERPIEDLTVTDVATGQEFGFHTHQDEWAIFFGRGKEKSGRAYNPRPEGLFLRMNVNQPEWHFAHCLRYMGFYNFRPDVMRPVQKASPEWLLEADGSNLPSVIAMTREKEKETIDRVGHYLASITGTITLQGVASYGEYETVRFRVNRKYPETPLDFDAASMSDGTLRVLASLVAAFQVVGRFGYPSLVAIEEPETSLHPSAMRALVDALDEATLRTQILLTTHSADMLDNPTIRPENIRVVQLIEGQTVIGPVDAASVEIVRRNLSTLGGLERENQLEPDLDDQARQQQLAQAREEQPS